MSSRNQQHFFHLVAPSPWPILAAYGAFLLTTGGVFYMHFYQSGGLIFLSGLVTIMFSMYVWWDDIVTESTFEGFHTTVVQRGLGYGMVLFISTEIMFFFAFFWGFFHSGLAPTFEIGCNWPPYGINTFDPLGVPLVNTLLLLLSGATITWAHYNILNKPTHTKVEDETTLAFVSTLGLAVLFTLFQVYEYYNAPFSISDSVYGGVFFVTTGFHGLHVVIGTIFIFICFLRFINGHSTAGHHFGFSAAAWYWHFVDVVWLFLYTFVYSWSGF